MRTHFIIMTSPSLDNYLGLGAGTEPFEAQAFVAELAVEALRRYIFWPRLQLGAACLEDRLPRTGPALGPTG